LKKKTINGNDDSNHITPMEIDNTTSNNSPTTAEKKALDKKKITAIKTTRCI